jgi:hypothetical protein
VDYESDRGVRPNNHLDRLEIYSQAKYQFDLQDSIFIQTKYQDNRNGDVFQYYDQNSASRSLAFREVQDPLALIGYHHEWAPGVHTLFLFGRLVNDQNASLNDSTQSVFTFFNGHAMDEGTVDFRLNYHSDFTIYVTELNQIWQTDVNTLVVGARGQAGTFDTRARFDKPTSLGFLFNSPAANQDFTNDYWRFDVYGYETFKPIRSLAITIGLSYDSLLYPTDYRNAPLLDRESQTTRFSPKVGVIWRPWQDAVLRAAYTRSLGGVSLEDSVRLEPTLVGGFNQALRTLIPESVAGTVDAARDNRLNLGLEQKIGRGTYLAIEGNHLTSDVDRAVGIFKATLVNTPPFGLTIQPPILPGATIQTLRYEENSLLLTANQLIGGGWSIGAIYTLNRAELDTALPDVLSSAAVGSRRTLQTKTSTSNSGLLQQSRFFALYNDVSGFFGRAEVLWAAQDNDGYPAKGAITNAGIRLVSPANGADFWQLNLYAGYRLPRNIGDITLGLLNLTNRDYRLNPLNEYAELPRSFTIAVQTRLNF